MSCILLDTELADKIVINELGVFIDNKFQGYLFRPSTKYEPTKQAVWCTKNIHGTVWHSGRLDYSEIPNFLPRDVRGEIFAKTKQKIARVLPV